MGLLGKLKGAVKQGHGSTARQTVSDISDDELDRLVKQTDGPVVVDFWAPWCAPCKLLTPALESLAHSYRGRASVVKVNVDKNTRWTGKLGIRGVPTIAFFSDGKLVTQLVGLRREKELRKNLEKLLDSTSAIPAD